MCWKTSSQVVTLIAAFVELVSSSEATSEDDTAPTTFVPTFDEHSKHWHSQYGQDRFIYERFFPFDNRRNGTFVELGAADGIDKSNTLAFERILGWRGVLIEPSEELFRKLRQNRPNSTCVHECVARTPGLYEFMNDGLNSRFRTHIGEAYTNASTHQHCRTMPQILDEHLGATGHIDYLSLDTEGSELEILQTFDFSRHTVDIISIEVRMWGDPSRPQRIAKLLEQRGFLFVERIVEDEIYVHRRGIKLDPSCVHPSLYPKYLAGNWADLRSTLHHLLKSLDSMSSVDWKHINIERDPLLNVSLVAALHAWQRPEATDWDARCPVGALTFALVSLLLHNRKTSQPFEGTGVALELRQHTALHPLERLVNFFGKYDYHGAVAASEQAGERFAVRLPLGRAWHESSFVGIIDSGWPFFGFLDVVAETLVQLGHVNDKVIFDGIEYFVPVNIPYIPCQLETPSNGIAVNLVVKPRRGRPPHASITDLTFDADACSLLGIAAARFHAARVEIQKNVLQDGLRDTYVPIVNWSASCNHENSLGTIPRSECSKMSYRDCAGVSQQNRAVASKCLRIRRTPGKSLQLRRPRLLATSVAAVWVEEGERLFREFVQRHGLYATVRACAMPALAPIGHKPLDGAVSRPSRAGETIFAVLHSVQRLLGHSISYT